MTIGNHVDVSNLTEEECNKIISVISKDILIRKSEKERAAYLNKKFEDLRREILIANQRRKKRYSFDDYCLICGKNLFTFCCFLQRGVLCVSCEHLCCTSCRRQLFAKDKNTTERFYICNLCVHKRQLKFRTSEWFYDLFQKRFKRFGSAKVLRAIYKQRKIIEPRVITLLAYCRVLQPSRIHSISSRLKSSQDDVSVSYSNGSSSERKGSVGTDVVMELNSRRRCVSESSSRQRSESESAVETLKGVTFENDLEVGEMAVEEIPPVEEILMTKTEELSVNSQEVIATKEAPLDEGLTAAVDSVQEHSNIGSSVTESVETVQSDSNIDSTVTYLDGYEETSNAIPLVTIALTKEESLEKDQYDEEAKQKKL